MADGWWLWSGLFFRWSSSFEPFAFMQTSNIVLDLQTIHANSTMSLLLLFLGFCFICMSFPKFKMRNTDNVQFTSLLNTVWWAFRRLTQFSFLLIAVVFFTLPNNQFGSIDLTYETQIFGKIFSYTYLFKRNTKKKRKRFVPIKV